MNHSKLMLWAQHLSTTLLRHARRNASQVRNIIVWFSKTNLRQHTTHTHTHTHTHSFDGPFSGTTQVSRYQKGKTSLDFTGARDSEWQWHQLGHIQVCTLLQTDNHASTPPLSFLQARCPSCHPTNSIKALKASKTTYKENIKQLIKIGIIKFSETVISF